MYITITYGEDRFSFEGETNTKPFKFGFRQWRTSTGKLNQSWGKIITNVDLKVSILDETLYKEMELAWQSEEDIYLLAEDNVEYKISFPEDFPTNYTFDYEGKKFYDTIINLKGVE